MEMVWDAQGRILFIKQNVTSADWPQMIKMQIAQVISVIGAGFLPMPWHLRATRTQAPYLLTLENKICAQVNELDH